MPWPLKPGLIRRRRRRCRRGRGSHLGSGRFYVRVGTRCRKGEHTSQELIGGPAAELSEDERREEQ
eukprot:scaffold77013_cov39-Tisochrysis_lutea.AAC.3